jgi:hypothetical protein
MKKFILAIAVTLAFLLSGCDNGNTTETKKNEDNVNYIIEYKEIQPSTKKRGAEEEDKTFKYNVSTDENEPLYICFEKVLLIDLLAKDDKKYVYFDDNGYMVKTNLTDEKKSESKIYTEHYGNRVTELKQYDTYFTISVLYLYFNSIYDEKLDAYCSQFDHYEIKTYTLSNNLYSYLITS